MADHQYSMKFSHLPREILFSEMYKCHDMKVLLDTNIWRYIIDAGFANKLFQAIRHSKIRICIAPAIVIETLRMPDTPIRRQIIELQTRDCWDRLMPDAFLECEDVKT